MEYGIIVKTQRGVPIGIFKDVLDTVGQIVVKLWKKVTTSKISRM